MSALPDTGSSRLEAFTHLVGRLPEPVLACSAEGEVLASNPATAALLAKVKLADVGLVLPTGHRELVRACLQHGEAVQDAEARAGARTLAWTYVPAASDGEAGPAVHVFGRDVTESRQTEAALRIGEARHRLLAEQSTDLISRHTPGTWTFLYASPAATTLLGYRPEELVGVSSLDLFHPDDRRTYKERAPTVAYERGIYVGTYRYRHKDGHYVWLESTSRTLRDPGSGELLEIISVSRDVSRRVLAERATRRLARIVEATIDLVVFFDGDGHITYLNEAARRTLALPASDNGPLHLRELMPPAAYARVEGEGLATARATGTWSGETAFIDARGRELPVSQVILAHTDDGDGVEYFSTVVRDMSERRHAEELAQRHQHEMAHVARLVTLGEMASGLAHELNQPLAAIVNYAHGAIRRMEATPPAEAAVVKGALERIAQQASRAGEIIRRLRGFARKSEFQRLPVDVNAVVREMLRFCLPEARRHGVHLTAELAPHLPTVLADRVQIEQVLLNLLRNAMEAAPGDAAGGHGSPVRVRSEYTAEGMVAVHVIDRGPGLPSTDPERLFEQFYTTKPKGLGLGLSISRSLMEAHGGQLWAEPNPEGGAIFSFTLPAAPAPGTPGA